jgi:hypothetical protein
MAVLNAHQRIDRVIPKKPWGDGVGGVATVSSDPNTRATYTGTAGSTSGTAGSTAFANGDLVLIHQTQGTGADQWEFNMVASGGGTTSLVMKKANYYTYVAGAQIIKVPRYSEATISAHSVTAWNGSTGGIEIIVAKKSITGSGALNATNLGFRGGASASGGGFIAGGTGEGSGGTGGTVQSAAVDDGGLGGGGAHAASGTNGEKFGGLSGGGTGSTTARGSADLLSISMGGAGGGGAADGPSSAAAGGNSGGILILISKEVTLTAGVTSNGTQGGNANAGGGSGSGGSVLVVCNTASLGTNNITALGSTGRTCSTREGNRNAGSGSVGRIAVHHSGTVTGTTNPTFTDVSDETLVEKSGGAFLLNLL